MRVYCPIHPNTRLKQLGYNVGPKKGDRRVGRRERLDLHFCPKCDKIYTVNVSIKGYKQ